MVEGSKRKKFHDKDKYYRCKFQARVVFILREKIVRCGTGKVISMLLEKSFLTDFLKL